MPSGRLPMPPSPSACPSTCALTSRATASSPDLKGIAAEDTRQALRDVLGYRLYYDLRRGWRITNPNLEQLGLLRIDYLSLDEACADLGLWADGPDAFALASPEVRRRVAGLVLDSMRSQLCIKTRYLDRFEQERIHSRAFNRLREPWGFSEDEHADRLYKAGAFAPIARPAHWKRETDVGFASYRSRLGRELGKAQTWGGADSPCFPGRMSEELYQAPVGHMLGALERYGIVERMVVEGLDVGWQVNGEALRWTLGDGKAARDSGVRTTDNPFFHGLYRNVAAGLNSGERFLHRLEAREHTAQVYSEQRREREDRFRKTELPVLFCSPTMELGVDIAELNTLYMRNQPPTPANYAQRSGRAGRSGQPAAGADLRRRQIATRSVLLP
jgi:Helicase conserved C-terminal domain